MTVLQVTSREFREKQASLFDLADKGQKIIIRRGKKKAYTLIPIEENDIYFTDKMLAKIDASLEEMKNGSVISFDTVEAAKKYFDDAL